MTIALLVLLAGAGVTIGVSRIAVPVAAAVLAAAVVDAPILRMRGRWWTIPDGAILTGLFVAMVLSPFEPWYVAAATSAVAVASKYVARGRTANVFNPAALGLVVTYFAMGTGHDWWGALADAGPAGLVALLVVGAFIVDRVNKAPLVLAFLGTYFLLFTAMAFAGDPRVVAEIFRAPDANAALFFACFILTDPPTSPVKYRDQIVCGVLVAVAAFVVFEALGAVHYLLSGVLIGNLWEAWRRRQVDRQRARERAHSGAGVPGAAPRLTTTARTIAASPTAEV
jgi:Na+-translocating ferredoxin:NAD+ oxidoreductase RnfD subunit